MCFGKLALIVTIQLIANRSEYLNLCGLVLNRCLCNSDDLVRLLVDWLWPTLIQQELDELRERLNNHIVRRDKNKKLPSGASPRVNMALYAERGGEWCLQTVHDVNFLQQLKASVGGEELIQFVSHEYAAHAQSIFNSLAYGKLSFENVWHVFSDMLPLV